MNSILIFILSAYTLFFIWDTFVELLNMKSMSPHVPAEFKDVYDAEKYKTSQEYSKERTWFGIWKGLFSFLCLMVFILCDGFNSVDLILRGFGYSESVTGIIFIVGLGSLASILGLHK